VTTAIEPDRAAHESRTPSATATWTALWLVYIIWGSTYLAIRVVVDQGLPPLLAMGVRFLTAGLLMLAYVVIRRGWAALRVTRRQLIACAVVGIALLGFGNGGVAIAEQTVPRGLAALLVAGAPLILVLLRLTTGDRPSALSWAGVVIGFAGVALLALRSGGVSGVDPFGLAVLAFGIVMWAAGSFYSKPLGVPNDTAVTTVLEMLIGGGSMLIFGLLIGEGGDFAASQVTWQGVVALAYLIVFGSLIGYSAYSWLLANVPISLTGTYAYVNPAVAVVLGALILDEQITSVVLIGGSLAIVGVALVVRGERPASPVETAAPAEPPGR